MERKILLNYSDNVKMVEEEEKFKFLQYLLQQIEISELDDILDIEYSLLTIELKIKLKEVLQKYKIQIIEGDDTDVYVDTDLIARWEKPTYKLKRDYSEMDKNKQLYQEMTCNFHSVFDESVDNEETTPE